MVTAKSFSPWLWNRPHLLVTRAMIVKGRYMWSGGGHAAYQAWWKSWISPNQIDVRPLPGQPMQAGGIGRMAQDVFTGGGQIGIRKL